MVERRTLRIVALMFLWFAALISITPVLGFSTAPLTTATQQQQKQQGSRSWWLVSARVKNYCTIHHRYHHHHHPSKVNSIGNKRNDDDEHDNDNDNDNEEGALVSLERESRFPIGRRLKHLWKRTHPIIWGMVTMVVGTFTPVLADALHLLRVRPAEAASAPLMAMPKSEAFDPAEEAMKIHEKKLVKQAQMELHEMAAKARQIEATQGLEARAKFEADYKAQKEQAAAEKAKGLVQLKLDLLKQGIDPNCDLEGQRQVILYKYGLDMADVSGTPFNLEVMYQQKKPNKSWQVQKAVHRQVIQLIVQDLINRNKDPLQYFESHTDQTLQLLDMPLQKAFTLLQTYKENMKQYGQVTVPKPGEPSAKEIMAATATTTMDRANVPTKEAQQQAATQQDMTKTKKEAEKRKAQAEKEEGRKAQIQAKEEAKRAKAEKQQKAKADAAAAKKVAATAAAAASVAAADSVLAQAMPRVNTPTTTEIVSSSSSSAAAVADNDNAVVAAPEPQQQQQPQGSSDSYRDLDLDLGDIPIPKPSLAMATTRGKNTGGGGGGGGDRLQIFQSKTIVPVSAFLVTAGAGAYGFKVYRERSAAEEEERKRRFRLLMQGDPSAGRSTTTKTSPFPPARPLEEIDSLDLDHDSKPTPTLKPSPKSTTSKPLSSSSSPAPVKAPPPATPMESPNKQKRRLGIFKSKSSLRETDLRKLVAPSNQNGRDVPDFATLLGKILTFGAPGRFPGALAILGANDNGDGMPMQEFDLDRAKEMLIEARVSAGLDVEQTAEIFANVVNCLLIDIVDLASSSLKEKNQKLVLDAINIVIDFMNHAASLYDAVAERVVITPPVTYSGNLAKSKLEQMYSQYAVGGIMNPDGISEDFDSRVALLADVFSINEKKAEGLMLKAMQKNMMEMIKNGGTAGLEQMMKNMGMDPSMMAAAMNGEGGGGGSSSSSSGMDVDPEALKTMLRELKNAKDRGDIGKKELEEVRAQFQQAFGASIDEFLSKEAGVDATPEDREIMELMKSVLL